MLFSFISPWCQYTYELGQFRRPKISGDDTVWRNPVSVDISKSPLSSNAFRSLKSSNQDTIGVQQILDGCALCQEFGVGTDIEANAGSGVSLQDSTHALSSTARNSRLLNNDLGALCDFGNTTSGTLNITKVTMSISKISNTPKIKK